MYYINSYLVTFIWLYLFQQKIKFFTILVEKWHAKGFFNMFVQGKKNRMLIPLRLQYKSQFFQNKKHRAEKWNYREIEVIF